MSVFASRALSPCPCRKSSCGSRGRAGRAVSTRRSPPLGSRRCSMSQASSTLTDVQKSRVVTRAGPVIRAVAQDERSQLRNRELAIERLVEKLREALAVPRTPRPDEAHGSGRRAPARGKTAASADEEAAAASRGRVVASDVGSRDGHRSSWPCSFRSCPTERTQLLDNLGRIRREVGPLTPDLSDALADHMNIRRGEVHEVVSFYSFLQVPIDAVRVCTGPVCDCYGARELMAAAPRRDRGRVPRSLRSRAGVHARRRDRPGRHALDERRTGDRARAARRDTRRLRRPRWARAPPGSFRIRTRSSTS